MNPPAARYPGRAPIDAYGNGGFRFAGMSHRGSILCLPSGIHAWAPTLPLEAASLALALAERGDALRLLLLGTGARQEFPARDYSDRSGFPRGVEASRGVARDALIPPDMLTPEALRPWDTHRADVLR